MKISTTIRAGLVAAALAFAALLPAKALAQSPNTDTYFYTPGGGGVNGALGMCLNNASPPRAVPCSSLGVLPSPVGVLPLPFNPTSGAMATSIAGNGTGSTGAVVGTLAGAASKTTYLCDFDVSAIGGTANVGPVVIAGLLGGSRTYQMTSAAAAVLLSKSFNPCLPASAANTPITITTTADGTATAVDVNSSGYQY